jgi:hypothetical protein
MNNSKFDFFNSKRPTPEQVAMEDRRGRDERISRLDEVLAENPKMGREEQIAVAQALYDLLDRIERERRSTKAKILREAGIGAEGDSTKHLSQYAISRDLPPEEIKRRSSRLRKGTKPYKNIAVAAAQLAGLDKGDVLLEVFEQANFLREDRREAAAEFVDLAYRLRLVADAISRDYHLTDFFREVERAGVSPALVTEDVQPDTEHKHFFGQEVALKFSPNLIDVEFGTTASYLGWPIELNQLTWLCDSEECGDLPAYPSVVLGVWRLGRPFPISILSRVRKTKKRNSIESQAPVDAQGWIAVVLSFCIAPIGKERSATPVLRVDLCTCIASESTFGWGPLWVPLTPGKVTVGNYEIAIERAPKLPPPFGTSDRERHASMETWRQFPNVLFLPINGVVCEGWFNLPARKDLYFSYDRSVPHRALGDSLFCTFDPRAPFSLFGSDTLAALVDGALCNPTGGLDLLMEQQVKRLKNAFETSRAAARDQRAQNWGVVKKRWARTADDFSGNIGNGAHPPKSPNGEVET